MIVLALVFILLAIILGIKVSAWLFLIALLAALVLAAAR